MAVDQSEFRRVMGHFATGVTIITTHDGDGNPSGLTANAVCSVSLNPPLVLVCVDKVSETYPCFDASHVFAINILSEHQEAISRRFASGRNPSVRMLWSRSASLTRTMRRSDTIARIILRKVSACSSSRDT